MGIILPLALLSSLNMAMKPELGVESAFVVPSDGFVPPRGGKSTLYNSTYS